MSEPIHVGDLVRYENRVTGQYRPGCVLQLCGAVASVRLHLDGPHFMVRHLHVSFVEKLTDPRAIAEAQRVLS